MSTIYIYHPHYPRILRVLDFFLDLSLTFFFQLLPFYITENKQLTEMANNRLIEDRDKSINDLEATFNQVIIFIKN